LKVAFLIKKQKNHSVFSLGLFCFTLMRRLCHGLLSKKAPTLVLTFFVSFAISVAFFSSMASAAKLPALPLQIGLYIVQAEIAADNESRSSGLMYRTKMENNQGMLFIFERLGVQCFWMKNTLLPLTAAFVNDQGKIVNMSDMSPQTEVPHCSKEPVRYVLEMNQGWFAARGIKEGAVIKGIP
jgi:uncharacterized membrane protein (UPF0127 family)